jgi:hypothetical protein
LSATRPTNAQRVSQRRQARLHAREAQRQRAKSRGLRNRLILGGVAVVAVAAAVFFVTRQVDNQPGRFVPIQGTTHIEKNTAHVAYNSSPPTSGPHWNIGGEAPVSWGIYKEQIPDEAQIHNLEHGGVAIQYNCRDCPELVQQIEDFYNRWTPDHRLALFPGSTKLVVAPYYNMPSRIALTAWGRIDTMDNWDEGRVIKFIEAWRNKGPEATP